MWLSLCHELGLHAVVHALLHLHLQVVLLVGELHVGALVAHLQIHQTYCNCVLCRVIIYSKGKVYYKSDCNVTKGYRDMHAYFENLMLY